MNEFYIGQTYQQASDNIEPLYDFLADTSEPSAADLQGVVVPEPALLSAEELQDDTTSEEFDADLTDDEHFPDLPRGYSLEHPTSPPYISKYDKTTFDDIRSEYAKEREAAARQELEAKLETLQLIKDALRQAEIIAHISTGVALPENLKAYQASNRSLNREGLKLLSGLVQKSLKSSPKT